jgi:release factor glutamine methyltransferase
VLVPRPDTETLVDVALDRTRGAHLHGHALDLCTGSGCVALAFANRRPTWQVIAADISPEALDVARHNAERLGALSTVRLLCSDLDQALPVELRFDLIMANPPYIPTGDLPTLMADVRDHEPHLALDGGRSGLDIVERVVAVAQRRLSPGGAVAIEVGHDQAERATAVLVAAGFTDVASRKDHGGVERVVSGTLTGRPPP